MPPISPELDHALLVYLFWAYTAAFALLFAYVGRLMRRLTQLERELERWQTAEQRPSSSAGAGP